MMHNLSEPLTPAHCDLRGFGFMPFDVSRLLTSDFFFKASGDEFKAAIALWSQSWWQLPAASLPNDDVVLAGLASVAKAKWQRIKAMALYGWVLCSDGRWYHPVLADKALEAMPKREHHQERRSAEAERKERERQSRKDLFALLRNHGFTPAFNTTTSELRELAKPFMSLPPATQLVTQLVTADVTGQGCDMSHAVTAKTETVTKTKTETETKTIKAEQQAATIAQPVADLSRPMSQPLSRTMSQQMSQPMSQPPRELTTEPPSQPSHQPSQQTIPQPPMELPTEPPLQPSQQAIPQPPISQWLAPPMSKTISSPPPNRQLDANPDAATKPAAAFRHRAIELAMLMRGRGAKVNSDNPHCIKWAESGVTDAQALSALETALERRQQRQDPQPVNAGLLNAIIEDLMREASATPKASSHKNRPPTLDERNNEISRKVNEAAQCKQ